jgi:predicted Zn-ribbon and HTH transcriptional regulator
MEDSGTEQTIRQQIIDLLQAEELTVRELSQAASIPEKEVIAHLVHIEKSVRNLRKKLEESPYKCLACGFVFDRRKRFTRPGRCPRCRNTHIQRSSYQIK